MTFVSGDFDSITEQTPLVEDLKARIAGGERLTFREFMAAALYHPAHGYYSTNSGSMGRGGDYVTSPEVHPVFGALLTKQLREMWERMGTPARFDVVECGGGRGMLARDIVAKADGGFGDALNYRVVETSASLTRVQRRTLEDAGLLQRVEWTTSLPADVEGCILSNELLDAFPVHRVLRTGDDLWEIYVKYDGGFMDERGPLSGDGLRAYFERLGLLPGERCLAEVNLDALEWTRRAAASLSRGYVLTLDYGYEASDLYAPWRRDGTLLCFYRQTASSDPYQRIGRQDMTSSVDFTSVRAAGEAAGLATLGETDQAAFLLKLGLAEALSSVREERSAEMEEYFARRRVVMDLIDVARLGRIRVLLQGRGVEPAALRGFTDG